MITGKELARKILEQVDAHPETLDMGTWETLDALLFNWKTDEVVSDYGTTRCIAGWAVYFNSAENETLPDARRRLAEPLGVQNTYVAVAGRLLGITPDAAETLFLMSGEGEGVNALRQLAQ